MSSPEVASLTMRQALDLYFRRSGFNADSYTAPTFTLKLLGIPFTFPSTAGRKRALPLHDFHHILTGYGTDWVGEVEISAWKLRAGCRDLAAYVLNGGGVIVGLLLSPRRVWRAFRAARGQHTLYREPQSYAELLKLSVATLRARLGIPPEGLA
jgi:hypothetical protein